MKTSWFNETWKKYVFAIAAIGLLSTGGSYLISGVNWWQGQNSLPQRVKDIEHNDSIIQKKLDFLINYVENKKKSFAVGYRVIKEIDEHKGTEIWKKQYRDFKGHWNPIFIDLELSDYYGFDTYYYIDQDTHEKVYCP